MAMKFHFMDELRFLKQDSPVETRRDHNTEVITTLKNRIKLLETENQLLKDDVSNKQKFIDTILEFNSKLTHNIDTNTVSSGNYKPVVNEKPVKEQPITENPSNRQRDDLYNNKKNNENKETIDDEHKKKKEKKKSKDKVLPETNKNVYILGDSMVKHVEGWKLKQSLGANHNVYVRSFSGAKVKCMKDYVKPCIREHDPDYVILHVGTNELKSESTPERIAKSVVDICKNIQTDQRTVSISGIVPRNDNFNNKAMEVNKELLKLCEKENLLFIDNSNINPKTHLNGSKIHLNPKGDEKLGKNFVNFIKNNYA